MKSTTRHAGTHSLSLSLSLSLSIYIYIYIYIYICVCVCVCVYIYIINQRMHMNISYRFLQPRRSGLYCAMQTESLNTISIQAVSHRPFSAEARLLFPLVHVRYGGGKSGNWTGFSAKTSVFLCQFHYAISPHFIFIYMFLIPKGQTVEACQPLQSSFRSQETLDRKVLFTK